MTIQTHTFPNGFRVIYETPENGMDITHINVFCRVGSAFENENVRGVSHFIEHMCFKGTPSLPTSQDIMEKYDTIGAYFNAYTEKQYTCYVSKFHRDYTNQLLKVLSDILLNSTFHKTEYEKEMSVVIEENISNLTDYENEVSDLAENMLYRGSVYANPVDALKFHTRENVWNYSDVIAFYRKYYVPQNMLLSIVTTVPFQTVLKHLKNTHFVKQPNHKNRIEPILNTIPRMIYDKQIGVQVELMNIPDIHTANVVVSFRTCSVYSEDRHTLNLLRDILGATFTSRMFIILRENNGLTYTSNVSTTYYEHAGDIRFFAITDTKKLVHNKVASTKQTKKRFSSRGGVKRQRNKKGVLPLIIDIIRDLLQHGVSENELQKTKQYLQGKQMLNMEDAETQVDYNGKEMFLRSTPDAKRKEYEETPENDVTQVTMAQAFRPLGVRRSLHNTNEIIPYKHIYDTHIKPITRTQIHEMIRKYFNADNMNVAIVGGQLPSKESIRNICEKPFI
jgi:predicted Zn-dependent peptidase